MRDVPIWLSKSLLSAHIILIAPPMSGTCVFRVRSPVQAATQSKAKVEDHKLQVKEDERELSDMPLEHLTAARTLVGHWLWMLPLPALRVSPYPLLTMSPLDLLVVVYSQSLLKPEASQQVGAPRH